MNHHRAFVCASFLLSSLLQARQDLPAPVPPPRVKLILPSNIQSEDAQVSYNLSGPFGGYGSFVRQRKDLRSLEISTQVEGIDAKVIKIITYMPGCAFKTYSFKLDHFSDIEQSLDCQPLPTVTINGKVTPTDVAQDQKAKVTVYYLAHWGMKYYGIMDGMVPMIRIGEFEIDKDGSFRVPIPDFSKDPMFESDSAEKGEFMFNLTDHAGVIAFLHHRVASNPSGNLEVRDFYASPLKFEAELNSGRVKNQVDKKEAKPKD